MAVDTPIKRQFGPWCAHCGHEYRNRSGQPEPLTWCPYCGAFAPVHRKPFREAAVSALEVFDSCEARYYFSRVLKLPEPESPYTEMGQRGHYFAERWLAFGELPTVNDLDKTSPDYKVAIALTAGIKHMPQPRSPGLEVEQEFHFEFDGVRFGGFCDFGMPITPPLRWGYPAHRVFSDETLIGDHKFVGSFNYVLPPDEFARTTQPIVYAARDMIRGAKRVRLDWIYMERGARRAKPLSIVVDTDHVRTEMTKIAGRAKRMLALRNNPPSDAKTISTNAHACFMYNSVCPFLGERCHVPFRDLVIAAFEDLYNEIRQDQEDQNMNPAPSLDQLLAAAQAPNGAPAAPPPFQFPQPGSTLQNPPGIDWARVAQAAQAFTIWHNGNQHTVGAASLVAAMQTAGVSFGGPVQNPAAPAAPPPAPAAPPPVGFGAAVNPSPYPGGGPEPQAPVAAAAAAPTAPTGDPGRKPGRPRKASPDFVVNFPNGGVATLNYEMFADAIVESAIARLTDK